MSNRYCWPFDQEFKSVPTATGICHTDTADRLIRSSRLYIQQHAYVKQILLTAWSGFQNCKYSNRHMSNRYCWLLDQDFRSVHTARDICHTDTADRLIRSSRLYIQQQAYVIQILLTAWSGFQVCTYSKRHTPNRYCRLNLVGFTKETDLLLSQKINNTFKF